MKIAYISNYLGPSFIERFCENRNFSISATFKSTAIARAMQKLGHEVTIFSPGLTVCNRFIKPHTEIVNFPEGRLKIVYPLLVSFRRCSIINSLLLYFRILRELRNKSYDLFLFYNITIDAALNLSSFKNKLRILEYEDNIFNRALKGGEIKSLTIKTVLFNYIIKRTDAALITGKGMLSNDEVKKKILIPGAVTEDVLDNISFKIKERNSTNYTKLLLAGGMHFSKGVDLVISALSFIEQPCELHLYGGGILDSEANDLLSRVPSYHKVIFHGFVNHGNLVRIMTEEADILINSTRNMGVEPNSEGYPFKMLEYASTGRPIVSSTIGRLDDNFNNLVTFYDEESPERIAAAISSVIDNYSECAQKAALLQTRVINEFSIDGLAKKFESFFKY